MKLTDCHNFDDYRRLAKKKLPSPIFHYIDGGSDDEITLKRNTESFNKCDLIPNVLTDVSNVDLSTTVLGQKIDFPLFLAASTISRTARFFLLAFLIKKYGNRMEDFINKYFNLITIVFTLIVIGSYVLIKFIFVP